MLNGTLKLQMLNDVALIEYKLLIRRIMIIIVVITYY